MRRGGPGGAGGGGVLYLVCIQLSSPERLQQLGLFELQKCDRQIIRFSDGGRSDHGDANSRRNLIVSDHRLPV